MKFLVALFLCALCALPLNAQTWTQVSPQSWSWQTTTWPSGRGWNWLQADGQGNVLYYAAVSPCGDPFSNTIWLFNVAQNNFNQPTSVVPLNNNNIPPKLYLWQSGGGTYDGSCVAPVTVLSDTTTTIGAPGIMADRHPMHQSFYDSTRNQFDQNGGITDATHYSENWHFDIASSAMIYDGPNPTTPTNMGQREEACIAYDPVDDIAVMYGGDVNGGTDTKTWVYALSTRTWSYNSNTTGSPNLPPGRIRCTMIWEPTLGKILLFGGLQGGGTVWLNDMWVYNVPTPTMPNPSWTKLVTSGTPPPSTIHFLPLAHDSNLGVDFSYVETGDTYAFNPTTNVWTLTTGNAGGPAACTPEFCDARSLAYDPVTDTLVMEDLTPGDNNQILWELPHPSAQ